LSSSKSPERWRRVRDSKFARSQKMHSPYSKGDTCAQGGPDSSDTAHAQPIYHLTFFPNAVAKTKTTESLSPGQLCERILNASRRKKTQLPWLKCATFGDKRTDKDSLRHDANVVAITGIELDYDGEEISFNDVIEAMKAIGIHAIVYTSPSHAAA